MALPIKYFVFTGKRSCLNECTGLEGLEKWLK